MVAIRTLPTTLIAVFSRLKRPSNDAAVSRLPQRAWSGRHGALLLLASGMGSALLGDARRDAQAQTRDLGVSAPPAAALDARSEEGNASSLPLTEETLALRIDDGYATVTHRHAFQNETKVQLEGTYKLMVGEGATATGFAYWNGAERIVGEVFERERAREVYEAITGLKRDPGLLEQTGEGSFSFRVFPITPGEKKRIEVTTMNVVPRRKGKLEYRARLSMRDAHIETELRDARGVSDIESPTHAITIEPLASAAGTPKHDASAVRVVVGAPKSANEPEFVLRYLPKDAVGVLHASIHKGEGPGFVAVTFGTAAAAGGAVRKSHDVTLVIDRSGSMNGAPMAAAKAAAKRVVDELSAGDAVNVIAFDDKVEALFDKPRVLDDATRRDVTRFLATIDARGGTEIAKALEKALASQTSDARPDVVFFLTDGQSDGPTAIKVAAADTSATSVFTVGLGEGVDKALLSKIASLKHGRFTFVADARAVTAELPKLIAQLSPPVLTDVKLRAKGAVLDEVYPQTLPDLFQDDELRVSGRLAGAANGAQATLVLEGNEFGKLRRFEVVLDQTATAAKPWIARHWALSRVDDLLGQERGTADERERAHMHEEVVDLGLTYALVTPYTSFLAIPEKELTNAAKDAVGSMRERKAKLLAANKDAAALSRLNMPPGDPILKVHAPRDARAVTAYFPFGLTRDLVWDEGLEQWMTRFLVPNDVADGTYDVAVAVTHNDGHVEAMKVQYTIDAKEPTFEVVTEVRHGGLFVRVLVDEPAHEVRVIDVVDVMGHRGRHCAGLSLAGSADRLSFEGVLPVGKGVTRLRVVVADSARNESDRTLDVTVAP